MRRSILLLCLLLIPAIGCPSTDTSNDDDSADVTPPCMDADDDGFCAEADDCDDSDPERSPSAAEACDGIDNDCNGTADFAGETTDSDSDGSIACEDCDDDDAESAPGLEEVCDGADNDCDGAPDADEVDVDGDGYLVCDGDCDDTQEETNPFSVEFCEDSVDNDCDGATDCADSECAVTQVCAPEDCLNGIDDDADGDADCADDECSSDVVCSSDFVVMEVDSAGTVGTQCSIALDASGIPQISYAREDITSALKFAVFDGQSWATETVDDGIFAGSWSSLAVDSTGQTQIAYYLLGEVALAQGSFGAWTTESAHPFGGENVSLALDADDEPHILHSDGDLMMYVERTGTTWTNDNVYGTVTGNTSNIGELKLGTDGTPHIGFLNSNFYSARYAVWDAVLDDWNIELADGDEVSSRPSMALDGGDMPHMVYDTLLVDELRYAVRTGVDAWTVEVVATGAGTFVFTDLALDGAGNPHIAWSGGGQLNYLHHDGASWSTQVIDSVGTQGGMPCLALDPSGVAHIGYHHAGTEALRYAVGTP
jgi:hypothetical protein